MCLIIALLVLAALFSLYFFLVVLGTFLAFLPWIIVGLIAGWAASVITESPHGLLGDLVIGLAGSIIGGVLYVALTHHRAGGLLSLTHLLVSIGGAVLLLLVIKAVRGAA